MKLAEYKKNHLHKTNLHLKSGICVGVGVGRLQEGATRFEVSSSENTVRQYNKLAVLAG